MVRIALVVLASLALACHASQLQAQSIECDLKATDGKVTGECLGLLDKPVHITLERSSSDGHWTGEMEFDGHSRPFDIVSCQYSDGPQQILRTPFAWFLPSVINLEADPPQLAWSRSAEAPPSKIDLVILDRARDLLRDESLWDRADDRICHPADTIFSLYCAMAEAVRQVTGQYQHRQPALQVVRRIVAGRFGDRVVNHRLMDFNNHPATTFAEVTSVLTEARNDLLKTIR